MNLGNCPRCGKLYTVNIRELCPDCMKVIEKEYEKCATFLREQKGATIHEVSEATEVSVRQITKFIKEGRISIANAPNLAYPCEVCGTLIRESNMCESCRTRLTRELRQAAAGNQEHQPGSGKDRETYSAVDKLRKY
ncbi:MULTISPECIES: TIGR03826 family flagellar region protein [Paenibacillus]|uniref:Flagellar protein n=1 Tax=Paenibacillus lautus TaxID=1401 RepID=A0A1R1AZV7_PAELA|nr:MULTISPECIES: TIGR03826 family flagellar region protein [Paenibacillus]MBT2764799.1 flagellar protein [Paenibacillus sp. ISL-20]OME91620.1 flagellar protein [Paenibacillus lautus]